MNEILFYLFSGLAVFSCLMVILSSNAVNSILFLVFAYLNVSALFVSIGADFAAMILMVVYVGAVAVLFLFVVMMLDTDYGSIKKLFHDHSPMILLILGFFIFFILIGYFDDSVFNTQFNGEKLEYIGESIRDVGYILYTEYVLYFQLSGMILLLAMIGAIALTLRAREGVRKQDMVKQVERSPDEALKNVKITPGAALKD
ncbi:MAG: NADH-quinone oxidoreductase subunit J [Pseudomonadota bacterium]